MTEGIDDPYTMQKAVWKRTVRKALGLIREKTVNATFGTLATVVCDSVIITNVSGKGIKYRRGGAGATITIPNGSGKEIDVSANANEIQIANADDNTNATVQYELLGEAV